MIGSTGRNTGKTLFAMEAISRWKGQYPVIALKVTSLDKHGGECHKGDHGCGACSSLRGDYEIVEELETGTAKDTSQLLKSGAARVYWLKSLRAHLSHGVKEFLTLIPLNALVVCESNSLRKAVKPGAFDILHNAANAVIKPTAQSVWDIADRVIDKDMRSHAGEVLDSFVIEDKNGELSTRLR
jgi:hypothetical protein